MSAVASETNFKGKMLAADKRRGDSVLPYQPPGLHQYKCAIALTWNKWEMNLKHCFPVFPWISPLLLQGPPALEGVNPLPVPALPSYMQTDSLTGEAKGRQQSW